MAGPSADLDGQAVESMLLDADVVEPTDGGDDLGLRRSVLREWEKALTRMVNPNAQREQLRELLGDAIEVESDDVAPTFQARTDDDGFYVRHDETTIGQWPSETAFRVDLAFSEVLADRIDDWEDLSTAERGELCSGARLFLDTCPDCDGDLSFRVTGAPGADSGRQVALLACEECDVALFVGDEAE